jgi:hypothetical protein
MVVLPKETGRLEMNIPANLSTSAKVGRVTPCAPSSHLPICDAHPAEAGRPTKPSWLRLISAILLALQFLTLTATAADKLEVDLIPAALRVRSGAPIPVQARFRWNGTYILEGHLEVELREANRVLSRYRSADLALTTGEQKFSMLLPPSIDPFSDPQVEAHMKYVTAQQVFDLGYSSLFMPASGERSFVLGWCNAHDQSSTVPQEFMFERMAPPAADVARKLLMTSVVRLAPEDLPAQPLAYTPFDVMVLNSDAFKEAREGQLRALARWVKGGGSVCVFVTGGLKPHHLAFLNELAESSPIDPVFAADSDGNLLPGHKKIANLYSGLGRSVVVMGSSAVEPGADSTDWRRGIAFLWKFRASQAQAIATSGHWETENNAASPNEAEAQIQRQFQQGQVRRFPVNPNRQAQNMYYDRPSYSVQPTELGAELVNQLMPHTVRLIPFGALMTTLGLFLLMIGPADYFVLGWLRRRRYTWLLFPAMSIAFMIATVSMANYYLGKRDQRRSLIVVDVGKDGTPLRWNRYELVFAARDKQAVTELKDALWSPLNFSTLNMGMPYVNMPYNPSRGYNPGYGYPPVYRPSIAEPEGEIGPPWYDGALPVHFRASQSIHQWQPQLNRIFSFEPPPAPAIPNWPAIEQAWPNAKDIRAKLSANKVSADVYVLSTSHSNAEGGPQPILSAEILGELCQGNDSGFLSLVSQVSPTGGGNFEDAQAMDSGAGDSALAIVTQTGDDIIVYRRFFHGK